MKAQLNCIHIARGVGVAFFYDLLLVQRPWPQALPEAYIHQARADDHALPGTIVSPQHHEEPSSWRLETYQEGTAGASRLPRYRTPVDRLHRTESTRIPESDWVLAPIREEKETV
jgi:hypothetical protein